MALWFTASAVVPALRESVDLPPLTASLFTSAVQAGFVVGTVLSALFNLADAPCYRAEIEHARTIRERSTSAHRQRAVYQDAVAGGAEHMEALRMVVDWLIAETRAGL